MRDARAAARLGLTLVTEETNEPLLNALLDTAIIAYARPFTANKPYGALGTRWSKFDSPDDQHSHERLLEHRRKVLAHSDRAARQVAIVPPGVVVPGWTDPSRELSWTASTKRHLPSPEKFADIEKLTEELGARIFREARRELLELFRKMTLPPYAFDIFTAVRLFGGDGA